VTNLNDSGPGSLRQAIIDTPTTGTVDFADGLSGTIVLTSAPLTINKILTIDGPGASVITVSGNHARQVFNILAPWTVAISELTIANGNVGGGVNGGGFSNGGALTITGCTFSGNVANDWDGGGIYNTGNLIVTNSIFNGNSTNANSGGGGIANTGNLTVTNSIFSSNSTGSYGGGGIYNTNTGTVTVTGSTFSGNHTPGNSGGGGIFNAGALTITGSTLSGNSADPGGGIDNTGNGNLSVGDSTFSGNSATSSNGGGIENDGSAALSVFRSTFSGNSAASIGGGIGNTSSSSNIAITNCTFNLNAAVNGAGIGHTGNGAVTLDRSTVSGNIASNQGGGIFHSGTGKIITLTTIVAGNRAFMPSVDVTGALDPSSSYNLIGDGTGMSGISNGVNGNQVGTAAMPIDPTLGPLQDNGGPTMTMELLPGSPALNTGDPGELGVNDQRLVPRMGGVNIGAYQASATAFLVAVPDTAAAGAPFDVTVTAVDPFGKVAIGYTGTVTFSSADPYGASLPADYTFQPGDAGQVTFPGGATLYTAGTWDVTATDTTTGITGSGYVTVTPAPAVQFIVTAPAQVTSGVPVDLMVTAEDAYGNIDTNYQGTVTFSTTDPDPGVVLPANYTFTAADAGVHTFTNTGRGETILITLGDQTITVTDTTDGTITGSATVTVNSPRLVAELPPPSQVLPSTASATSQNRGVPLIWDIDLGVGSFAPINQGSGRRLIATHQGRRSEAGPWISDEFGWQDVWLR
jgi:hypothetical protein